jgi:glycosyltransferase involved in cell wall biosynthesis
MNNINLVITRLPKVSIIITTFKRPNLIIFAVNNALEQTYSNIEIIVVDDNGQGTECWKQTKLVMLELIQKHSNIKYIENEINYGIGKSRNIGVENSSGEFIAFLDDDDKLKNNKIHTQLPFLYKYDLVLSCAEEMFSRKTIGRYGKNEITLSDLIFELKPIGIAASVIFKRSIFDFVQYCPDLKYAEDYDFFLNVAYSGYRIGYIDEPLYIVNDSREFDRLTQIKKNHTIDELENSSKVIKKNRKILGEFYYKKGMARVYLYNIHKKKKKWNYLMYSIKRVGLKFTFIEVINIIYNYSFKTIDKFLKSNH